MSAGSTSIAARTWRSFAGSTLASTSTSTCPAPLVRNRPGQTCRRNLHTSSTRRKQSADTISPEIDPPPHAFKSPLTANQDTAFDPDRRDQLGLRGLLPPAHQTLATQVHRSLLQLRSKKTDLGKYIFLSGIRQTNVRLFYAVIMSEPEEVSSVQEQWQLYVILILIILFLRSVPSIGLHSYHWRSLCQVEQNLQATRRSHHYPRRQGPRRVHC